MPDLQPPHKIRDMDLTFWNVGRRCATVQLSDEKPTVDLSDVTFITPFALMYLGMFLRHFNAQGKGFSLRFPQNDSVRDSLAQQRFWERFNFNAEVVATQSTRWQPTLTSLNDIVDLDRSVPNLAEDLAYRVTQVLAAHTGGLPLVTIEEMVAELVQNFVDHAGKQFAAFLVQYYPKMQAFSIAIGDCGRGVRASLSALPKYRHLQTRPHREAVLTAFQYGASAKPGAGGAGFSTILDGVEALEGELRLATGQEYVIASKGRRRAGPMGFSLPGVQIELIFQAPRAW
ncbi:MAG: hypothetical protein ACRERD_33675 [Candidatus Binatia bacterium]